MWNIADDHGIVNGSQVQMSQRHDRNGSESVQLGYSTYIGGIFDIIW